MIFTSPFPNYLLDSTAHSARSRPNGLCSLAGNLKTGRWKLFFSLVLYCMNHKFIDSINLNLLAIRKGIKAVLGTCEMGISDIQMDKVPIWRSNVINEIWLILNYSKVVWDIFLKFSPFVHHMFVLIWWKKFCHCSICLPATAHFCPNFGQL